MSNAHIILRSLSTTFKDLPTIAERIYQDTGEFVNPEQIKDALRNPYRQGTVEYTKSFDGRQMFRRLGLKGLGWICLHGETGCFFDDRDGRKEKARVVGYLNHGQHGFWYKPKTDAVRLTRPIPRSITDMGRAVEWVYFHAEWR